MSLLTVSLIISGVLVATPPESHLERMKQLLGKCLGDVPTMVPVAEEAATRLSAGGKLWASGQPSLVSEISGRAGGFMMIRPLGENVPAENDVILHTPEAGIPEPKPQKDSKALWIAFGPSKLEGFRTFANHAAEFGVSPTLANAVPAWLFTGELIAALTRLGKMPVIYESIGTYSGNARIQQYKNGDISFHEAKDVPPAVPAGQVSAKFVMFLKDRLDRLEKEQRGNIELAGKWAREAKAHNRRLIMYSMGHLFPDEVGKTEIGKIYHSDVWNAGFHHPTPQDTFASGEFIAHIGYQQPPDDLLRKACPVGARVAYLSVRPDRDFMKPEGPAVWIDCMWDWPDACVSIQGYDAPLLASSGILNGAVAWEIYRLTSLE